MNFGPLEFADYLRRKDISPGGESATVKAARAAAPAPAPLDQRLAVISTTQHFTPASWDARNPARDADEDSEL